MLSYTAHALMLINPNNMMGLDILRFLKKQKSCTKTSRAMDVEISPKEV